MAGKPIRIAVLANGKQARSDLKQTESALSRLGGVAKKAGKGVALGLVVAGAAAVKLGIDSVKAASDSEQSIGATESIFKQYADTVIERSKKASQAVGLSANEYRELNNQLGAMLKNSGKPLGEVAGLTDKLTKRAADMSAMFGGTTREAVEALSSALRGETDPIERYGVSINDAALEAELARKGLSGLKGEVKDAAKKQARLDLIFRQTSDAAGQFGRESDTLAGKQQRLAAKAEDLKAKFGKILTPVLLKAADVVGAKVLPAIEDGIQKFGEWWPSIQKTSKAVGAELLPVLRDGASILGDFVGLVKQIPTPLLQLGAQAALAAYAVPKLAGAFSAAGTSMSNARLYAGVLNAELRDSATRGRALSGVMKQLGGAARNAAGVGGVLALSASAKTSNGALKTLASAGGGAMLGFAVGGPYGAAIGGTVGLMTQLYSHTTKSTKAAEVASTPWQTYADTLDRVSGAITRQTRAQVIQWLQNKDLLKFTRATPDANGPGLNDQLVINGILGKEGAQKKLNAALEKQLELSRLTAEMSDIQKGGLKKQGMSDADIAAMQKEAAQRVAAYEAILKETGAVQKSAAAKREEIMLMAKIPAKVVTKFEALGAEPSKAAIVRLSAQYKLTPKQVKTSLELAGVDTSSKRIKGIIGELKTAAKQKAQAKVDVDTKGATKNVAKATAALKGIGFIKIKPPDVKGPVSRGIAPAKATASSGGVGIGVHTAGGFVAGINAGSGAMASATRSAVRNAIAAGRNEAAIASPSKKTKRDGRWLAKGYEVGIRSGTKGATRATQALIRDLMKASSEGAGGVSEALRKRLDEAGKTGMKRLKARQAKELRATKGKKQIAAVKKRHSAERKAAEAGTRATTKRIMQATAKQRKAVGDNGLKRAALADGDYTAYIAKGSKLYKAMAAAGVKNLEDAREALKTAKEEFASYAQGVADSVRNSANLATLAQGNGFGSMDQLLTQRRALAAQAVEWKNTIAALTKAGLNKTDLDELIQMGPEAGLGTAKTILGSGSQGIKDLNGIAAQLDATAKTMGQSTATTFKKAGIDAAQGLVNGLTAQSKQLDAAAKRLAKVLADAVRKELKIKSPSRVFKALGKHTTDGLVIGLDEFRVAKAGQDLAAGLRDGFGRPALSAVPPVAGGGSLGAGAQPVHITIAVPPTADLAAVGKAVQQALDAYTSTGGRVRAA